MKLSEESFVGLKRHFLGALTEPSRLWIVPSPGPRLLFTARGVLQRREGGCTADFGTVNSPGQETRTLRVSNLGAETITVALQRLPSWLDAHWVQPGGGEIVHLTPGEEGAELALTVEHDFLKDTILRGSITFLSRDLSGNQCSEEIPVRMATRRALPVGLYDFHGSPEPHPHDFGVLDPTTSGPESLVSFTLSIQSLTSIPLVVSFADLPAWLSFEVDGYQRRGPSRGRFFERAAPFTVEIRPIRTPQFLGSRQDRLCLWTNDARPEFQMVDLQFSAKIESARPVLRAIPPERVRAHSSEPCLVEALVENWGQSPAQVTLQAIDPALHVAERPVIPGALDGQPGRATLQIQISPAKLSPGPQALTLTLRVDGGVPPEITLPVGVDVVASQERDTPLGSAARLPMRLPPAIAVAALFTLLLLLALIVLAVEGHF